MTKSTGVNRNKTLNMPCAAEAIYEGYVYKLSSGNMTVCTTVNDKAYGVAAQSSMDWELNTARTMVAGENWQFYPLGCEEIVNVASLTSLTWKPGAKVYLDQSASADGLVSTDSSSSATVIGHYKGPQITTSAAGQLIQVILDTPSIEAST